MTNRAGRRAVELGFATANGKNKISFFYGATTRRLIKSFFAKGDDNSFIVPRYTSRGDKEITVEKEDNKLVQKAGNIIMKKDGDTVVKMLGIKWPQFSVLPHRNAG